MVFRATGYGAKTASPALSNAEAERWRQTSTHFERNLKPALKSLKTLSVDDKQALLKRLSQDWHALGMMSGAKMNGTPQAKLREALAAGIAEVKEALATQGTKVGWHPADPVSVDTVQDHFDYVGIVDQTSFVDLGNASVDFVQAGANALSANFPGAKDQFMQGVQRAMFALPVVGGVMATVGKVGDVANLFSKLDGGVIKALGNLLTDSGKITKPALDNMLGEASKARLLPDAHGLEYKLEGAFEKFEKYGNALDKTLAELSKYGVKLEGQALETFKTEVMHAYVGKTQDMTRHIISDEFALAAQKVAGERWGLGSSVRGFYIGDFSGEIEKAYKQAGRPLSAQDSAMLREATNQLALKAGTSIDNLDGPLREKEYGKLCAEAAEALFGAL